MTTDLTELQRRVMTLDTAWVRRQEPQIHNYCEGHALCDLISSVEALQREIQTVSPDSAGGRVRR